MIHVKLDMNRTLEVCFMAENEKARLKEMTCELKLYNRKAKAQFTDRTRRPDYSVDFFGEVKPFADHVQHLIDSWRPLAETWVREDHPEYVYPIQIKDTYDNLSIICVTAFQKDTRRRRFLEMIKSIDYVLDNILEDLRVDQG